MLNTNTQSAAHSQSIRRAALRIGVNDGGKEKKRKKKRKEMAVPRAAAAYGRQLKIDTFSVKLNLQNT